MSCKNIKYYVERIVDLDKRKKEVSVKYIILGILFEKM